MRPRAIEVRIGELVLEGVSPADHLRIGTALEGELTRLLRERGLPAALHAGVHLEAVDAGPISPPPTATPAALGGAVAAAVYSALGRSGGSRV
jgi:hypothetical protein